MHPVRDRIVVGGIRRGGARQRSRRQSDSEHCRAESRQRLPVVVMHGVSSSTVPQHLGARTANLSGAVGADGRREELPRLRLGAALGQVERHEAGRRDGVRIHTAVQAFTGDLGDPRVVILLTVDAEGVQLPGEIGIDIGVCGRRQQHRRRRNPGQRPALRSTAVHLPRLALGTFTPSDSVAGPHPLRERGGIAGGRVESPGGVGVTAPAGATRTTARATPRWPVS